MAAKSKKSLPAVSSAPVEPAVEPVVEAAGAPGWTGVYASINLESFADMGRENIAAMTKANLALSEGLQAIGQEILTYAKSSFETASHTATALLGAKTLDEVIEINSGLAKTTLETMVERSAKLSEMGVSVANGALAPFNGQVEAAIAKFSRPIAA